MTDDAADAFRSITREIIQHIADGDFDRIRLDPDDDMEGFKLALQEYGRTFAPLPEHALDELDVYKPAPDDARWCIELPLWTKEEGRSDMWLYLTIREENGRKVGYVRDVRVP